jgi:hypothetical protein
VDALAGIGHPPRFFATLTALGYELVQSVGYGDHQAFDAAELLARFGQRPLLMTEKDAVKCRPFAPDNWWYLPVSAELPDALGEALLRTVRVTDALADAVRDVEKEPLPLRVRADVPQEDAVAPPVRVPLGLAERGGGTEREGLPEELAEGLGVPFAVRDKEGDAVAEGEMEAERQRLLGEQRAAEEKRLAVERELAETKARAEREQIARQEAELARQAAEAEAAELAALSPDRDKLMALAIDLRDLALPKMANCTAL